MATNQTRRDLAARAAWFYYVAGLTQNEIAERLSISRQMTQRLIAFAQDNHLVQVQIQHPVASCLELAEKLKSLYGLQRCRVVPSLPPQPADKVADVNTASVDCAQASQRMLALAGADFIERYIASDTPLVISVGSGRTLKAAITQLSGVDRPQHRIVSLVGAFGADGSANRYDVALQLSDKTASRFYLLPAPRLAQDAADRAQWCNQNIYKVVSQLADQADLTFLGIGTLASDGAMHSDGFITDAEVAELNASGAVAELLGCPMDAHGRLLTGPVNQRTTSFALTRKPAKPVIGIAGGIDKAAAVMAVLRGQWLTGLVTDEVCAHHAIDHALGKQSPEHPEKP